MIVIKRIVWRRSFFLNLLKLQLLDLAGVPKFFNLEGIIQHKALSYLNNTRICAISILFSSFLFKLNYPRLQGEGFGITDRFKVDLIHSRPFVRHFCASRNPVFFFSPLDSRFHGNDNFGAIYCSDAHGRPHSNPVRDMSRRISQPFRKSSLRRKARGLQRT